MAWSPEPYQVAVSGERLLVADILTGGVRAVGSLPDGARLLGWVGPEHVLAVGATGEGEDGLVLVDAVDGDARTVARVDPETTATLSVATGLMTPGRPTAEFPPPSWVPWYEGWLPLIETVGGLVLLGGLVFAWRRSRRADRRPPAPWPEESS